MLKVLVDSAECLKSKCFDIGQIQRRLVWVDLAVNHLVKILQIQPDQLEVFGIVLNLKNVLIPKVQKCVKSNNYLKLLLVSVEPTGRARIFQQDLPLVHVGRLRSQFDFESGILAQIKMTIDFHASKTGSVWLRIQQSKENGALINSGLLQDQSCLGHSHLPYGVGDLAPLVREAGHGREVKQHVVVVVNVHADIIWIIWSDKSLSQPYAAKISDWKIDYRLLRFFLHKEKANDSARHWKILPLVRIPPLKKDLIVFSGRFSEVKDLAFSIFCHYCPCIITLALGPSHCSSSARSALGMCSFCFDAMHLHAPPAAQSALDEQ